MKVCVLTQLSGTSMQTLNTIINHMVHFFPNSSAQLNKDAACVRIVPVSFSPPFLSLGVGVHRKLL